MPLQRPHGVFAFAEVADRLLDEFLRHSRIRFAVHGRIRIAAGPERFGSLLFRAAKSVLTRSFLAAKF